MKRIISSIVLCLIIIAASTVSLTKAQDGVFSDAQTLGYEQFALSVQPIIYTEVGKDDFMLMLRGAYGVKSDLTLHGKIGVLRDETYFGGHLEYMLAGEPYDPLSFSLLAGVYSFGDVGLKFGGVLSKQVGSFSLYSGLMFEPLFTDPDELTPLLLPIGVDIPVSGGQANFVFEADLALNDDAEFYEALHFGFNIYF
jgi:hypothetical protein